MKLSEKKRAELYAAIADPVMDERIHQQRKGAPDELDGRLFQLQHVIWRRVHRALNLEGPA